MKTKYKGGVKMHGGSNHLDVCMFKYYDT